MLDDTWLGLMCFLSSMLCRLLSVLDTEQFTIRYINLIQQRSDGIDVCLSAGSCNPAGHGQTARCSNEQRRHGQSSGCTLDVALSAFRQYTKRLQAGLYLIQIRTHFHREGDAHIQCGALLHSSVWKTWKLTALFQPDADQWTKFVSALGTCTFIGLICSSQQLTPHRSCS